MASSASSRSIFDPLTILGLLIAALALVAAGTGLLWTTDGGPLTATSVRGETVELYGRGLYRFDTRFAGAGARGADVVTLVLGLPFLLITLVLRHRGSLRGSLLLTGALAWFLYVYASLALGTVTYNALFLVYVSLFSASLFAFGLALREAQDILQATKATAHLPRLGPAALLFGSGLVTAVVWLGPLLSALTTGQPPERLDTYTGRVTDALDLGIITPSTIIAGIFVLRRKALGFAVGIPLFVLEAFLLPMIAAQTVSQIEAGVAFSLPEVIGPIGGFVVLAGLSLWVLTSILRQIPSRAHPTDPPRRINEPSERTC
jgi:hypothetical protein